MSTPKLQRVGGGCAQQRAVGECSFQFATVLGQISGAIRRDSLGEVRVHLGE